MNETKKPGARRLLRILIPVLAGLLLLLALFNLVVDPYGAFGDRFLKWWSYDMTQNPRLAKLSYLNSRLDDYDSYVLGGYGAGFLSVEDLNAALRASFYNCAYDGAGAEAMEQTADDLLAKDEVKHLILAVSPAMAASDLEIDYRPHYKSGGSVWTDFPALLFGTARESVRKLRARGTTGYLPAACERYDPKTGERYTVVEDAEPIHGRTAYLESEEHQDFSAIPDTPLRLDRLEALTAAVGRIRSRCAERGIPCTVICVPQYLGQTARYDSAELAAFYDGLAAVGPYWDFSGGVLNQDPRFFYDPFSGRTHLGRMALAKLTGSTDLWVPADYGRLVEAGSAPGGPAPAELEDADYTLSIPILCYHHISEGKPDMGGTVSVARFREQMEAVCAAGFTTVDVWQLRDFVERGVPLPEKPILVSFDDGYESNYTLAFPILRELNMKATIFAIGVSIGKDTYKDTGEAMLPHFSLEQAEEMRASGLITISSHGYNIHEVEGRDPEPVREGILMREGETEAEYVEFLAGDVRTMFDILGESAGFLSYPTNRRAVLAEVVVREGGIFASVAGGGRTTRLVQGLPQSLYEMRKLFVKNSMTGEILIEKVSPDAN